MSAEMELALLSLHVNRSFDVLGSEQTDQLQLEEGLQAPGAALITAAATADSEATVDRFAAAQAMFLGVQIHQQDGADLEIPLRRLGAALLRSVSANAAKVAGAEQEPADILLNTLIRLSPDEGITDDAVANLVSAFGSAHLQVRGSVATDDLELSGAAAWLVMLLLELFTNGLQCNFKTGEEMVDGVKREVMFVEVDVCTNQPFSHCKGGINPLQWPASNPYFLSVHTLGPVLRTAEGWTGVIKERVGCPFNGLVYETDLAVTMIERPGISIVSFDLAKHRTDPGLVLVDRGFLSATDEGTHRRIRVLKVYLIDNLTFPHNWVCPLWASQVAMAAWWQS